MLINSAGLHSTGRTTTKAGFETVFCVNHLAPFLLTSPAAGRMKQSAPARIIQVNSEGHRFGGLDLDDLDWKRRRYAGLQGYGASKIAQLLTTWEFADRLQGLRRDHQRDAPGRREDQHRQQQRAAVPVVASQRDLAHAQGPGHLRRGAVLPGRCARAGDVSGRFFHLTIDEKPAAHALDRDTGRRIWDISLRLTGLTPGP